MVERSHPDAASDESLSHIRFEKEADLRVANGFVLLQRESFTDLQKEMENILGRGSEVILVRTGYTRGQEIARKLSTLTESNPGAVLACLRVFAGRTGLFSLEGARQGDGRLTVRIGDSFIGRAYGHSERAVCHYVRGFLTGAAEAILTGPDLVCVERTCVAQGAVDCVFEIVDVSAPHAPSDPETSGGR